MKNRRKKLVINKKFQYQYGLLAVSLTVLVANVFLLTAILLPGSSTVVVTSGAALVIGLAELVLLGAVWFASIRFSHKVAGPVFVFNRQIKAFCEGDTSVRVRLREKDLFQDEAAEINNSLAKMEQKLKGLSKIAEDLQVSEGKGLPGNELIDDLVTELAGFRGSED
jgi:methyl-accepting chemotaxis protein